MVRSVGSNGELPQMAEGMSLRHLLTEKSTPLMSPRPVEGDGAQVMIDVRVHHGGAEVAAVSSRYVGQIGAKVARCAVLEDCLDTGCEKPDHQYDADDDSEDDSSHWVSFRLVRRDRASARPLVSVQPLVSRLPVTRFHQRLAARLRELWAAAPFHGWECRSLQTVPGRTH